MRLDLLGYTLKEVEEKYNEIKEELLCHDFDIILSFEVFSAMLKEIDVNRINTPEIAVEFEDNGFFLGEFVRRCIISEKEIYSRLLTAVGANKHKLNFDLETFFENMDPYIILRLLAENQSCCEL